MPWHTVTLPWNLCYVWNFQMGSLLLVSVIIKLHEAMIFLPVHQVFQPWIANTIVCMSATFQCVNINTVTLFAPNCIHHLLSCFFGIRISRDCTLWMSESHLEIWFNRDAIIFNHFHSVPPHATLATWSSDPIIGSVIYLFQMFRLPYPAMLHSESGIISLKKQSPQQHLCFGNVTLYSDRLTVDMLFDWHVRQKPC